MAARRIASALAGLLVLISIGVQVVAADALDEETRRIGKQLQCPVCQGASVTDSPSDLAGQMRAVIRRKLEQGESEQEIIQYFVERYGDAVLVEPPRRGVGLAVWLGPMVVLAVGAGILGLLVRTWLGHRAVPARSAPTPLLAHRNGASGGAAPEPYDSRVRAELERFRRES